MNCKQPRTEKQLGASASEIVYHTMSLEKATFPVCGIKIGIYAMVAGAVNSEYCQHFQHAHSIPIVGVGRERPTLISSW